MKGQPYRSVDFASGLKGVLGSLDQVLAFGPLNTNFEWHLTVRSDAAMQRLLEAGAITVKDTCVFTVRALTTTGIRVRVHWAPYYLPMAVIAQRLEVHGEVVSASWDKGDRADGFGDVASGVRTFTTKGVKRADLPPPPHRAAHRRARRRRGRAAGDGGRAQAALFTLPAGWPHTAPLRDAVLPPPWRLRPQH